MKGDLHWVRLSPIADKADPRNFAGARWGHTMTVVGTNAFVYGGVEVPQGETDADVGSSSMWILRMAASAVIWERLHQGYHIPQGRWRHTASLVRSTELVIFGGYRTLDDRLNDVWVFDCISRRWRNPESERNTPDSNIPSARAAHSAVVRGEAVVIFGGYGGSGKSRRHFNDVHSLDTQSWLWSPVETAGALPPKRSSHQAHMIGSLMYVFGGSNSLESLSDVWCLDFDVSPPTWNTVLTSPLPSQTWSMASCYVSSIPSAKIFLFGGMKGPLQASGIGVMDNSLSIFDSDQEHWVFPAIENSSSSPTPCSDCTLVMDTKNSRLILFAGWADRWLGDIYSLDVSKLIGPPYLITGISPSIGPITGGTDVSISGIDFFNTANIVVRFGSSKEHLSVPGVFSSQSLITCVTPDFNPLGRVASVDVRIALEGDSFTTSYQVFEIFTITSAANSLMFGPGLLSGCAIKEEVSFIILARDNLSCNRTSGGDEFSVKVFHLRNGVYESTLPPLPGVTIKDRGDGKYLCRYSARHPGKYLVNVEYLGSFGGTPGPIRGSGCIVEFDEFASRNNNVMAGALMIKALKDDILEFKERAIAMHDSIFVNVHDNLMSAEDRIRMLVLIKETIALIGPAKEEMQLLMDRSEAILAFLKERNTVMTGVEPMLEQGKVLWSRVLNESDRVLDEIAPLMVANTGKIRADIFKYQCHLEELQRTLLESEFVVYATGHTRAIAAVEAAEALIADEANTVSKVVATARVFDCLKETAGITGVISGTTAFLRGYRLFWDCCLKYSNILDTFRAALWSGSVSIFDEQVDSLVVFLKRLPISIKTAEVYSSLEHEILDFAAARGIIRSLQLPCMRERHWLELSKITQTKIQPPGKNPALTFGDLIDMNLSRFVSAIEALVARAEVESRHEDMLAKVQDVWSSTELSMNVFSATDVPLLYLSPGVLQLLEDNIISLGLILRSEIDHFHKKASEWQQMLTSLSIVMLQLQTVQKYWSLLQPLFEADEIRQELLDDAKQFRETDSTIRFLLTRLWKAKVAIRVTREAGLLLKLKALQSTLELCKKSIWDFIGRKRQSFPRYCFVADDEILRITAASTSPSAVIQYIQAILPGTKSLILDRDKAVGDVKPKAISFLGALGAEKVEFDKPVSLSGHPHEYFAKLIDAQAKSLAKKTEQHMHRYLQLSRELWIIEKNDAGESTCPAQIILLVAHVYFTHKVEHAMYSVSLGESDALSRFQNVMAIQLNEIVRLAQTKLIPGDRIKAANMILFDAYCVEVTMRLTQNEVNSVSDFIWQSFLRCYNRTNTKPSAPAEVEFSLPECVFQYGFEYISNCSRVAITPLAEKIYVSIALALSLQQGVIVAGRGSAGKSATLSSLAFSLGKYYMTFDCDNILSIAYIDTALRGILACGCWGTFLNLNALPATILSVFATSAMRICTARASGKAVQLGDTHCKLTNNSAVFGTFSIEESTTLTLIFPRELKASFRISVLMVPNYTIICELALLAAGFADAKALSSVLCNFFELIPSALPGESTRAWGLPSLIVLVDMMGVLRRDDSYANISDFAIALRVIRDSSSSRVPIGLRGAFTDLLASSFPGISIERRFDEFFADHIANACDDIGLWADKEFSNTILLLDEMQDSWATLLIVGPPGVSKSASWKALLAAQQKRGSNRGITTDVLVSSLFTLDGFFGYEDKITREWHDGAITRALEGNVKSQLPVVLVIDGLQDAAWCDHLRVLLHHGCCITLPTFKKVSPGPQTAIIIEATTLDSASPGFIADCGVLCLAESDSQRTSILGSWVRTRPYELYDLKAKENIFRLIEKYFHQSIQFTLTLTDSTNEATSATHLTQFLEAFIVTREILQQITVLENFFVFCLVWCCGANLSGKDGHSAPRYMFSEWFRKAFPGVKFPNAGSIFDYWYNPQSQRFESWTSCPSYDNVHQESTTSDLIRSFMPSPEAAAVKYFSEHLLIRGCSVIIRGAAGGGKSMLASSVLTAIESRMKVAAVLINGFTRIEDVSTLLCGKVLNSSPVTVPNLYFIEDLEFVSSRHSSAPQPTELLRHLLDTRCCYDFQRAQSVECIGKRLFCTSSHNISMKDLRFSRHFISFDYSLSSASINSMLFSVYQSHLSYQGFPVEYFTIAKNLVKSTMQLFDQLRATFHASRTSPHYNFADSLLFRTCFGLHLLSLSMCDEPIKLILFWMHEMNRSAEDMIRQENGDMAKYHKLLSDLMKKDYSQFYLSKYFPSPTSEQELLVYCHFSDSAAFIDPTALMFDKVEDISKARANLSQLLSDFDGIENVVLFDEAMILIAKLARLMCIGSHSLILGPHKSGKKLAVALSASLLGQRIFHLNASSDYKVANFRMDWADAAACAGLRKEKVVLLVSEKDIVDDAVFGYLIYMLSPSPKDGLYSSEFKENVMTQLLVAEGNSIGITAELLWSKFVAEVSRNVTIFMVSSTENASFHRRARLFPQFFVKFTVIVPPLWTTASYESCAVHFLKDEESNLAIYARGMASLFPYAFVTTKALLQSTNYYRQLLFESDYVKMVRYAKHLYVSKSKRLNNLHARLLLGLERLAGAESDVVKIQENMEAMADEAVTRKLAAEDLEIKVKMECSRVDEEKEKLSVVLKEIETLNRSISAKTDEARTALASGDPFLEIASGALELVNRRELGELAVMTKPPEGSDDVFAALAVLLAGKHPHVVVQKSGRVKQKDLNWDRVKSTVLANINILIDELNNFRAYLEEGSLHKMNLREVRPYLLLDHFKAEIMERRSEVSGALCAWIRNMVDYADLLDSIEPLRLELGRLKEEIQKKCSIRDAMESDIAVLESKKERLEEMLGVALEASSSASRLADNCELKLEMAKRLLDALATERKAWTDRLEHLSDERDLIAGDSLLEAAVVALTGCLSSSQRAEFLQAVVLQGVSNGSLSFRESILPLDVCCSLEELCQINICGLYLEPFKESAAILCKTLSLPLLVDPLRKGLNWLTRKYPQTVSLSQADKELRSKLRRIAADQIGIVMMESDTMTPVLFEYCRSLRDGGAVGCGNSPKIYICATVERPQFNSEVLAEVAVIDFTVHQDLAHLLVRNSLILRVHPDVFEFQVKLEITRYRCMLKLVELEDRVLSSLAGDGGDSITSDKDRILEVLNAKVEQRVTEAGASSLSTLDRSIETSLAALSPLVTTAAVLYAISMKAMRLHRNYHFSFSHIERFFIQGVAKALKVDDDLMTDPRHDHSADYWFTISLSELLSSLERNRADVSGLTALPQSEVESSARKDKQIMISAIHRTFSYISLNLSASDKLLIASIIAISQDQEASPLSDIFLKALIDCDLSSLSMSHPTGPDWAAEGVWRRVASLEESARPIDHRFSNITDSILSKADVWKDWYLSNAPEMSHSIPPPFDESPTQLTKLLLFRSLRPDRFTTVLMQYVAEVLGEKFLTTAAVPDTFLSSSYPLIYLAPPAFHSIKPPVVPKDASVECIAIDPISLPSTLAKVQLAQEHGSSIYLSSLELLDVDSLSALTEILTHGRCHPNFKMLLSISEGKVDLIPPLLVQNSIFMVHANETRFAANVLSTWSSFSEEAIERSVSPALCKRYMIALAVISATVQLRTSFINGWNNGCLFDLCDVRVAEAVCLRFLGYPKPASTQHITSYLNSFVLDGCTDSDSDKLILSAIVSDSYYNAIEAGLLIPTMKLPDTAIMSYAEINDYLASLALPESSASIGLSPAVEFAMQSANAEHLATSVLRFRGENAFQDTLDDNTRLKVVEMQRRCPAPLNSTAIIAGKSSTSFEAFLWHEIKCINAIIAAVKASLSRLLHAIDGKEIWNNEMRCLRSDVKVGVVNHSWCRLSWPFSSSMSLTSWLTHLISSANQLRAWIGRTAVPPSVWLPGILIPKRLIVAMMQQAALKYDCPLSDICLRTCVTVYREQDDSAAVTVNSPSEGILIKGCRIFGAEWTSPDDLDDHSSAYQVYGVPCGGFLKAGVLAKVTNTLMPLILLLALPIYELSKLPTAANQDLWTYPLYYFGNERYKEPLLRCQLVTHDKRKTLLQNPFLALVDT